MKRTLAVLAAALACACTPPAPEIHHGGSASSCIANADARWTRPGAPVFTATASTQGPDCAHAVATLILRDPDGVTLYTEAMRTDQLAALEQAHDAAAMQVALAGWLAQINPTLNTTGDLPAWAPDANSPQTGEFPFIPAEGIDRTMYATLRTHPVPLYCFTESMQSQTCLAWQNNELDKIGAQTFPG